MKKHLKWIIPVVVVVLAVCVFGYLKLFAWNPERQKVAQINTRQITVAQFGREMEKVPSPYKEMLQEDPKQFLDQLVLQEVLLQEAERLGVKSDANAKPEEKESSQIQNLLKKEVIDKVKVNKEEIEILYKEHQSKMGKKKLDEVAPLLEELIRDAKGKEKVEEYITSLREKAKVEIDEKRLKDITARGSRHQHQRGIQQSRQRAENRCWLISGPTTACPAGSSARS